MAGRAEDPISHWGPRFRLCLSLADGFPFMPGVPAAKPPRGSSRGLSTRLDILLIMRASPRTPHAINDLAMGSEIMCA